MSVGAFAPGSVVAPVTPSTHPPMRGFRDYGPSSLRSGWTGRVEAQRRLAVGPEVRPYPGAEGQDPAVGTPPLHLETTWSRRQPVRRVRILAVDALLESAPVWNFYG